MCYSWLCIELKHCFAGMRIRVVVVNLASLVPRPSSLVGKNKGEEGLVLASFPGLPLPVVVPLPEKLSEREAW